MISQGASLAVSPPLSTTESTRSPLQVYNTTKAPKATKMASHPPIERHVFSLDCNVLQLVYPMHACWSIDTVHAHVLSTLATFLCNVTFFTLLEEPQWRRQLLFTVPAGSAGVEGETTVALLEWRATTTRHGVSRCYPAELQLFACSINGTYFTPKFAASILHLAEDKATAVLRELVVGPLVSPEVMTVLKTRSYDIQTSCWAVFENDNFCYKEDRICHIAMLASDGDTVVHDSM